MELFVTDKAQHLDTFLLSQRQNLLCRLTTHDAETKVRKLSSHQGEDFLGKPKHAVLIWRVGKASHKEHAFPALRHFLHLHGVGEHIGGNGLYRNAVVNLMDFLHL